MAWASGGSAALGFGALAAAMSLPGFLKSDAVESPSASWTRGLALVATLYAIPMVGAALSRRAQQARVDAVRPSTSAPT